MVNFAPSTPWYRRFVIGDRWPNKTSWHVLEAEIRGTWLIVERHTRECWCSYCRGEHGHGPLWLPADRAMGWRVINLFHRLYIRWVPHRRNHEPRYSKEANFQVKPTILLEELRNRVRERPQRPEVLTIRADQLDQLADELNSLNANPFNDVEKITPYSIQTYGCWVYGIPIKVS